MINSVNSELEEVSPKDPLAFDEDDGDGDGDHPSTEESDLSPSENSSRKTEKATTNPPLHGILRKSTWTNRQSPEIAVMVVPVEKRKMTMELFVDLRTLWKGGLLVLIPLVGYILSQLYPSSILFHFTFLCLVYGIVDLMDQDPSFSFPSNHSSSPRGGRNMLQQQPGRNRRVDFVEGTKFYRMPKPMSRKQKRAFCERRFRYPPFERYDKKTNQHASFSPPLSVTSTTISATARPPSPPAPIDWETTNRLLKIFIESQTKRPQQRQSSPPPQALEREQADASDPAFEDAQENEPEDTNEKFVLDIENTTQEEDEEEVFEESEQTMEELDALTVADTEEQVEYDARKCIDDLLEEEERLNEEEFEDEPLLLVISSSDGTENEEPLDWSEKESNERDEETIADERLLEEEEEQACLVVSSYESDEGEERLYWSSYPVPSSPGRCSLEPSSPSKLIGSDSAIARLRMAAATKPLQEFNRQEQ